MPDWEVNIEIIKNGEIWNSTTVTTPLVELNLADSSIITGTSYNWSIESDGQYYINEYSDNPINPLTLNTGGVDFYLIRVVGANGRTSYVGPIWVESLA